MQYQSNQPQQWQPQPYRPQPQYVTKQTLSGGEHIVHAILTFITMGLWAPVWIIRAARGRRTVTNYQQPPGYYR